MKFVIDASIGFKWEVVETDSDKATRLRAEYHQGIHELLAPELFSTEIANALLMAERRGRILPGQGAVFLADLLTTRPRLRPARIRLLTRAFEIAEQTRTTVYDCLYVALAEREQCELVTADDRLVRSLQGAFPFIRTLASMP
jgi:predicted nucleic acid-binding protein